MMLEFKVSGVYKNGYGVQGKRVDFECTGLMPVCDDVYHQQNVFRLIPFWVKDAGYKERFEDYECVHIESFSEVDVACPIDGKNIKDLDWLGLQYLACKHHLNSIPLYNNGSLYDAKIKACKDYIDKIQEKDPVKADKLDEYPDLILSNDNTQAAPDDKLSNEEILSGMSNMNKAEKDEYTLEELKALAKDENIPFHTNIGYVALYKKVFG